MNERSLNDASEPLFEHPVAEQVLAMAARLQQEHRDKISLSQLRATAAEVGIEPQFVAEAVQLIGAPIDTRRRSLTANVWTLESSLVAVGCLIVVLCLQMTMAIRPSDWIAHVWMPILGIAVAAAILPRQITTRIGLVAVLAIGFAMYFPIDELLRSRFWPIGGFLSHYMFVVAEELIVFAIVRTLYFAGGRATLKASSSIGTAKHLDFP